MATQALCRYAFNSATVQPMLHSRLSLLDYASPLAIWWIDYVQVSSNAHIALKTAFALALRDCQWHRRYGRHHLKPSPCL